MSNVTQLIKDIKKLNERAKELYKTFGESQKQYKEITNIFSHISDDKTRLNSKGFYQLSHGKKFVESLNKEQIEYIERALKVQTRGQLIKEELEVQKFINPNNSIKELRKKSIEKIIEKNQRNSIIEDNLDIIYKDEELTNILHRKGRRLYKSEFDKIQEYLKEWGR